jgi:hypothetical protein
MKSKKPPKIKLSNINKLRKITSALYDRKHILPSSIIFSNDGTGTGKTYSVINEYLENHAKDHKHHNLIFTSPLKTQFDFPKELVKKAHAQGIEILIFLSQKDRLNLDFIPWVHDINNNKETNKKKYNRWIKAGKNSPLEKELIRLKFTINEIINITTRIDSCKKNPENDYDNIKDLEDQLKKSNRKLDGVLKDLAIATLNFNNKAIDLKKIASETTGIESICKEIICHLVPFAIAIVKPCILLATTNKFDCNIELPYKKKNGDYSLKSLPFDCIIGGKQHIKENETGLYVNATFEEQSNFLKNTFFEIDHENFFKQNNITFTVVIDEEHEAHKIFASSTTVNMITDEIQLAHVFAAIARVYNEIADASEQEAEEIVCYEDQKQFITDINYNLTHKCELSNNNNIKSLLNLFTSNVKFIQIKSGDIEQIIYITRSVFSFTPKRFLNEQGLKNIRVKSAHRGGACQLYYSLDEADKTPSLHDVYQLTMAILSAASKIPSNSEFLKFLSQGVESSQNYTLHQFIKKAQQVKSEVSYMFDRAVDEELNIDHFFTYFVPKTVFSINKVKNLDYRDKRLSQLTQVSLTLDLVKEQTEVALLRMLYETNNYVICLSATSGFNNNITGNYNRNFLTTFRNNLGINIVKRTEADIEILSRLRNQRAELRKVEYKEFSSISDSICNSEKTAEFKNVYQNWKKTLKPFIKDESSKDKSSKNESNNQLQMIKNKLKNKHHKREFYRSLETMLLAAYDNKNTLSLSLTANFMRVIKEYLRTTKKSLKASKSGKITGLKIVDNSYDSIFEFAPFDNKVTIRVILFNSQLATDIDVRKFTHIKRDKLKIVFMSSYRSAGTGLNYFITHPDFEEDFERLVLINSPFYSDIISDALSGDKTLYSLTNILTLMKYYANNSKEIKKLKDFDINLANGKDYHFLMSEHLLELLKVIMQAIGRVERRDTYITTEIYLPDSVVDDAMLLFNKLSRDIANKTIFASFSLLNYKFVEYCKQRQQQYSFSTDKERNEFQHYITDSSELLQEFFEMIVPDILEGARQGNKDAIKFNEALRSIESITNPVKYLDKLRNTKIIKSNSYYEKIINKLFINLNEFKPNLKLYRNDTNNEILTDIIDGDRAYYPEKTVILDYSSKMQFSNNNITTKLIKVSQDIATNTFNNYIPHHYFMPMLKGNMGEYIFKKLLDLLQIKYLSINEIIKKIGYRSYELFDFYIELDGKLICFDVKNWSSTFDKLDISSKTHVKAKTKIATIKDLVKDSYQEIIFVYINMRLENNPLNSQEENNGSNIYYLNMFKEVSGYTDKKEKYSDKNDGQYKIVGSKLKSQIEINTTLIKLLQG